jgi:uncharacterized short protein YbdD (DUF466 family)
MRLGTEVEGGRRGAGFGRVNGQLPRAPSARRGLRSFLRTLRQIVGAPDYERYLEHQAARHPECAPLTPREYYAEFVTRRFGGGGPTRCC